MILALAVAVNSGYDRADYCLSDREFLKSYYDLGATKFKSKYQDKTIELTGTVESNEGYILCLVDDRVSGEYFTLCGDGNVEVAAVYAKNESLDKIKVGEKVVAKGKGIYIAEPEGSSRKNQLMIYNSVVLRKN